MSMKITFMHGMKWIRVIELVYWTSLHFLNIFFLSLSFSIGKRSDLVKIWGQGGGGTISPPAFRIPI